MQANNHLSNEIEKATSSSTILHSLQANQAKNADENEKKENIKIKNKANGFFEKRKKHSLLLFSTENKLLMNFYSEIT
jgi:hypothetical protein